MYHPDDPKSQLPVTPVQGAVITRYPLMTYLGYVDPDPTLG